MSQVAGLILIETRLPAICQTTIYISGRSLHKHLLSRMTDGSPSMAQCPIAQLKSLMLGQQTVVSLAPCA